MTKTDTFFYGMIAGAIFMFVGMAVMGVLI